MDSGCSRHMTGQRRWFSSLTPTNGKDYITFGDKGQGKIVGVGSVSVSEKFSLREVVGSGPSSSSSFELWKWHRRI